MIKVNGQVRDGEYRLFFHGIAFTGRSELYDALVDANVAPEEAYRIAKALFAGAELVHCRYEDPCKKVYKEDHPSLTAFERNRGLK